MNTYETPVNEIQEEEVKGRKGVTLIEALFVLGIMAVLIGMVMVLLSQTTSSTKTNQLTEEVTTIVDAVHQLYQGQASYSGLDTSVLAQSGLLPNRYVGTGGTNGGSNIVNPFGSNVTVTGQSGSAGSSGVSAYFEVDIGTVPQAACVKVLTTDFGSGMLNRTPGTNTTGPESPANLSTDCPSSSSTDIQFTFE